MYETYIPGFTPELWGGDPAMDFGVYGGQMLPTAQPVQTAPYDDGYQSLPTAQPVYSQPYVEDYGYQSQPTAQPVEAMPYDGGQLLPSVQPAPEYGPLDLGDWNPSMVNLNGLNVLSDPGPAYDPNLIYYFHTGNDIGVPNASGGFDYRGAHPIQYTPGQTYKMLDKKGNVVATASSPEEMQRLVAMSKDMPAYTMELVGNEYGQTLPSGGWLPSKTDAGSLGSMLVNMGALALPAVGGSVLGPMIAGGLGSSAAVGTGLGTALGSAASGITAGKSIEDILKQAAIAGITAGGLQALTAPAAKPNIGDLQAQAIDTADFLTGLGVNPSIASQIAQVPGGTVSAFPTVIGDVGSAGAAVGSGAGALGGGSAGLIGGFNPATQTNTVIGSPSQTVLDSNMPTSFLSGALEAAAAAPGTVNYGDKVFDKSLEEHFDGTLVKGDPGAGTQLPGAPVGGIAAPVVGGFNPATQTNTVVADKQPPQQDTAPGAPVSAPTDNIITTVKGVPYDPVTDTGDSGLGGILANTSIVNGDPNASAPADKGGLSTADYIRLAALGISTIGGLLGGGNKNQNATISGGMGGLNSVFNSQLPNANLPGLGGSMGAPRTAADLGQQGLRTNQDWYRYGYGPEQSFFNRVPQSAPNTSQAYTGYAEGGLAVEGPGDGREDKIPAMLSDGEYVIDAETVALLGNGSNKAGADLLDKFRVNIRKHKGRELSRGKFSKNAKKPEQYLAGGRA